MKQIKKKLTLRKINLASLNQEEMNEIIAGGLRRSQRRNGDCNYSRNHYTHCTEADHHSHPSQCCHAG